MSDKKNRTMVWFWGRRGGGARYTYELIKALSVSYPANDFFISVSDQNEYFDDLKKISTKKHVVSTFSGSRLSMIWMILRLPFLWASLYLFVRRNRITHVVSSMCYVLAPLFILAFKLAGAKYIAVVHDADPHPGEDGFLRTQAIKLDYMMANGIVTLTNSVKEQVHACKYFKSKPIDVIPHGVFDYFNGHASLRTLPQERPIHLLFYGRILTYKGIDLLIESFNLLRLKYPSLILKILGSGRLNERERELYTSSAGLLLENRWVQECEIADQMAWADIIVLPYREASQSGVIPISCAAGIPVVVTPVGGLKEQVEISQCGVVADGVSAESFAKAIESLMVNKDFYELVSANALRAAKNELCWKSIADRFQLFVSKF